MPATLHVAYDSNNRDDIPGRLRKVADAIEAGEFGDVVEGALVLNTDSAIEVFGWGSTDGASAHLLLACGCRKLELAVLNRS